MKKYISILVAILIVIGGSQIVRAETYTDNLSVGATGPQVESLQTWLVENGYLVMPPGVAKGYFGAKTRIALMNYQKFLGLPNTGFFGPLTRAHFNKDTKVSSLTVTSPNGGENWAKGSYHTITWNAPQYFRATYVDIKLVPYNPPCPVGYVCTPPYPRPTFVISEKIDVNQHAYVWKVGYSSVAWADSLDGMGIVQATPNDGEYTVQICETGTTVCDSSDRPFTISKEQTVKPTVTVISPNGGEKWPIKSVHQITWTNTDTSSTSKVDIYIYKPITCNDALGQNTASQCVQNFITLDKNIPTDQIYNWIVGTDIVNNPIPVGNYIMRICIAGTENCRVSRDYFSITTEQSPLVFTVTTDKKEYTNNEDIQIHYQAYNPTNFPVTLNYTSGCKSKFTIDNVFDSMRGIMCTMVAGQEIVNPRAIVSWDMVQTAGKAVLPVGIHTITASLIATEGSTASTQITIK